MQGFAKFCLLSNKGFYEARPQLLELADVLYNFVHNGHTSDTLNVSLPARFGKSRIATDLSVFMLANDPNLRILRASYSADLAEMFSTQVQSKLIELWGTMKISGTRQRWRIGKRTEPAHVATGVTGTITGFGCDIAIIDDTAKNIIDATSAAYRRQLDSFRESVLYSRLEGVKKIINVGTRWCVNDWFSNFPDAQTFVVRAMNEDGTSCCEAWKTTQELKLDKERIRDYIWDAQYQQTPTATGKVRLFEGFDPVVEVAPIDDHFLIIDPATDYGTDYFVIGDYISHNGFIWLYDMFASQAATPEQAAEWIKGRSYRLAYCEANGVGKNVIGKLRKCGCENLVGFATSTDKYSRAYLKVDEINKYLRLSPYINTAASMELYRQADEFPVGEHDDLIDNIVMAFEKLNK